MNRLTGKTYSDALAANRTATVNYTYDSPSSVTNAVGRLTKVTAGGLISQVTGYDALGRATGSSQTTGGVTYPFGYSYYFNGGIKTVNYPSGRAVTTTPDGAGRPYSLAGSYSGNPTTYVSSTAYASHGAVSQMAMGNGLTETTTFDQGLFTRRQPTKLAVTGGINPLTLQYAYCSGGGSSCSTNNGNVWQQQIGIVDSVNGSNVSTNWTQTYAYGDGFDRLTGVSDSGGTSQAFSYDNYGNRAVTAGYTSPNGHTPTALTNFNTFNQLTPAFGAGYDAAGNVTTMVGDTFQYDAESRMTQSNVQNTGSVNYTYDGDGKRVAKSFVSGTTTSTTTYVYDSFGELAAEYSTAGATDSGTSYVTADFLGSTRMISGSSGTLKRRYDYFPFGEYIPNGTGGRGNDYPAGTFPTTGDVASLKYTSKERDSETGLDYFGARYFSGAQGRFTSVDPAFESQYVEDPQTWNRYSYVYNRPLSLTDPDGRCPQCLPALGVGLIGGAIGAGITLASGGNTRDAAASFAGGFVAAGLPVLTLGTSLLPELTLGVVLQVGGVGAASNAIGGAISRGLDSDDSTMAFDPFELAVDGGAGFAFGNLGNVAGLLARQMAAPSRPSVGHVLKKGGIRALSAANRQYRSAVQGAERTGQATGVGVGLGSGLVNFFRYLFAETPPPAAPPPPRPPDFATDSRFRPWTVGSDCGGT